MLMHCPVNAWLTTAAGVPAMRLSTVFAACAPSGSAAWQLIRSGWPDGAAASPAATMRGSSTLVSVSSVSSRPSVSVCSPLRAASSGTPKPAVHTVTRAGQHRAVSPAPPRRDGPRRPSRSPARRRRGGAATWPPNGGRARSVTAPAFRRRPGCTGRPCSASSEAVSMPVSPAPTTVTGAAGCSSSRALAEPLGLLEFGYRIGEFGGAGHCGRDHAGAADGVDQVVVVQHRAGRQFDGARGRVDPFGVVDQQSDAFAEQSPVVDGCAAACRRPADAGGFARRTPAAG